MTSSPNDIPFKNMKFSKDGMALICPVCLDSDTYKIGQLDRDKWGRGRHNYWTCKKCRELQARPVPVFPAPRPKFATNDIDELLEMI